MNTRNLISDSEQFSDELISIQTEKILKQPPFATSDILRRFLKYIIDETLAGRADQIKEYTIAVYVLNKPATFRPLNDGIVRVHACRLRDALSSYYDDQREDDICVITIPKGSYVPVFRSLRPEYTIPDTPVIHNHQSESEEKMRIAIMPFNSFEATNPRLAFADNIGRLISAEFVHCTDFSVLSYYTTQQLKSENKSVKNIASEYRVKYVLVGNVWFELNKVRVSVQLINAGTEILLWSKIYTHDFSISNSFETEDAIVYQVISELEKFSSYFNRQKPEVLKESKTGEVIENDIIDLRETRRKKTV